MAREQSNATQICAGRAFGRDCQQARGSQEQAQPREQRGVFASRSRHPKVCSGTSPRAAADAGVAAPLAVVVMAMASGVAATVVVAEAVAAVGAGALGKILSQLLSSVKVAGSAQQCGLEPARFRALALCSLRLTCARAEPELVESRVRTALSAERVTQTTFDPPEKAVPPARESRVERTQRELERWKEKNRQHADASYNTLCLREGGEARALNRMLIRLGEERPHVLE